MRACDLSVEKAEMRERAKAFRQTLDITSLSVTLCERLAALPEYQSARHVLLYLAMPEEVTIDALLNSGVSAGKQFYLPRCAPKRRLAIHSYVPGETPLRSGPFGIREPDADLVPEVDPALLNMVIVPAVLLSEDGDRLGYGGGYYDRFLPRLSASCVRLGALPGPLVLPSLPCEAWDVALDLVLTENQVFSGARSR